MDKFEQLQTWLNTYESIGTWLYFNVIPYDIGNSVLQSVPGNTVVQDFNDGSKEHDLVFALAMVKLYDDNQSSVNIDAIKEIGNFIDWLNTEETLPRFDSNITVNYVEVLENVPTLSVDSTDQPMCKYQFQCKVNYLEQ